MNIQPLIITEKDAQKTLERYQGRQGRGYRDIQWVCQEVLNGKMVFDLQEVMILAGLNEDGFPRMAIVRADAEYVYTRGWAGVFNFTNKEWDSFFSDRISVKFHGGHELAKRAYAPVPIIPPELGHFRLRDYYILWECEWQNEQRDLDPLLCKRLNGNLFCIEASWDMTPLEAKIAHGQLWK